MFWYLLLAAAIINASEETTINPELQEIITLVSNDSAPITEENSTTPVPNTTNIPDEPTIVSDHSLHAEPEQEPVIITNAIQPTMLAYKHWTGTYNPDKFILTVNGNEITQGQNYTIENTQKLINVSYSYSFMNGMRSGGKTVSYKLKENITQAQITFSWKDDWRVLVDNATPIKQEQTT